MIRDRDVPTPFYRVSVKALVFDAADRLLVVQEPAGHWELPGGGWEHGETLEQCLARELREELGVRLRSVDLASQRAWASPGVRRRYHRLKLTVRATLDSPQLTPGDSAQLTPGDSPQLTPGDEILSARWVTPAEFAALPIAAGDEPLREHVLAAWPAHDAQAFSLGQ